MNRDRTDEYILIGLLLIPTIWFALLIAPYADNGLFNVIPELGNYPHLRIQEDLKNMDLPSGLTQNK